MQLESLFDIPPTERSYNSWDAELPLDEREWHVGMIVGPSGSGKSTLARQAWPGKLAPMDWPEDAAVIDAFPEGMSIKEVVSWMNGVGFSSPPAWLRPYRCLSTGEQFRVSIARALAESADLTVVDEFTSVVDRKVAKVASATVAKHVRRTGRRFVAVTCHYDVEDWLQPDWVWEADRRRFRWREVGQRPPFRLDVYPASKADWPLFRQHHYLSGSLSPDAELFGGWIEGEMVAFNSAMPRWGTPGLWVGHRTVVLPDWQGLGIGGMFMDWLGQHYADRGLRYRETLSHWSLVQHYIHSPRWREVNAPRAGRSVSVGTVRTASAASWRKHQLKSRSLGTYSFEYVPEPPEWLLKRKMGQ